LTWLEIEVHNENVATTTLIDAKQHAHELIDRIPPDEMIAAVRFLEFVVAQQVEYEDEEISEEEEQAAARAKEWFKHNQGTPFEEVVAELGFTMDQIRNHKEVDV
jgi:kynurenine formamidase